ncbi:MAG: ExeA family protein [Candidatus Paceibacterales bacterium]
MCRTILNRLDNKTKTAFILNPNFSELQLLQLIIKDLGILSKSKNKAALITALNEFLLEETSKGHNVVLIIDEAQNLQERQLEQIRLLSNLETEKEKLLQIILVGQPELCDKLKLNSLRQLNQRITVRYHILPLEKSQLQDYIFHRLKVAGANEKLIFSNEAIEEIYLYSGGTPRLVNIICDRALLAGYVAETFTIDYNVIKKCIEEVR